MPRKMLENLAANVKATTDVGQAVIMLITGLVERFRAVSGDQNAADALVGELENAKQNLVTAVLLNTPAEPPDDNATVRGDGGIDATAADKAAEVDASSPPQPRGGYRRTNPVPNPANIPGNPADGPNAGKTAFE